MVSLWDLGNVMVNWDPEGILSALNCPPGETALLRDELLMHEDWQRLDQGTVEEALVTRRLIEDIGVAPENVARCFELSRELLINIDKSIELLQTVKAQRQRAYCLSNMSHSTYAHLRHRSFFSLFDGIVISAQERLIKPDPAIFDLVLQRFELQADEVLFIDDSAANIESAMAVGIDCVHFKRTENCYDTIRRKLGIG